MCVTLVVPCYNEAARLDTRSWQSWRSAELDFRFVDDDSDDGALLLKGEPRYRVEAVERFPGGDAAAYVVYTTSGAWYGDPATEHVERQGFRTVKTWRVGRAEPGGVGAMVLGRRGP